MKDVLLIIYLAIFDVMTIANIITILYFVKRFEKKEQEQMKVAKATRRHTSVKTSNYNNSYNTRGYDRYKNKDGLYEPQKPHQGIELKAKKEE
ncbi:MAG: hypothetical protein IJK18_08570 [Clostridia bacterium]|jgi:hypothetical protein|nr:hypothetical protein [Clostridia bacterium]